MPIFKHDGKLLYFSHVPKCAGSSIENYLISRLGPAAFLDRKFPPGNRHNWSRTSPQHISAQQLDRLFPPSFFDDGFAFIRDPLARVRSAFHYHQSKRRKIPEDESFESWLPRIANFDKQTHARFDDHFRPQSTFVPDWCKIFWLEEGFDSFILWLDEWTGTTHPGRMGHVLHGKYTVTPPSDTVLHFVQGYYAEDYARFGTPPAVAAPIADSPPSN